MDWKSIVKTVAPWIGTTLAGPLGGLAVNAIGEVFGLDDRTEENLRAALVGATPEQMLALKKADEDFTIRMKELGFKHIENLTELEFQDRDSARKREMEVKDNTNKWLAYITVIGFIVTTVCTLAGWAEVDSVLAGTLIGYISAKCEQVLSYYFGSSRGSDRKTEIMARGKDDTVK